MKNEMKTKNRNTPGYIIIVIYSLFVLFEYVYTNFIAKVSINNRIDHLAVFALILIALSPHFFRFFSSYEIRRKPQEISKRNKILVFSVSFLLVFALFFAFYLRYPDRTTGTDVDAQLKQVYSGVYNDWHPVIHTLLVMAVPIKLTGSETAIYVFQYLAFGIAFGYMCETIYQYSRNLVMVLIPYVLVLFNPYTYRLVTYPLKDVSFAILGMLLMTFSIRLYYSEGKWFDKKINVAVFVISLALATLFRHNGILFTLPLLLVLFFNVDKKKLLKVAVLSFALVVLIKYPLYTALDVQKPGDRMSETIGVCMNVIGNSVKENNEALSDETLAFAYDLAPQEIWNQCPIGDFNKIKFGGVDTDKIDRYSLSQILMYTADCLLHTPREALSGFFRLTDFVYGFNAVYDGKLEIVLIGFGLGVTTFCAIYTIFARSNLRKKEGWNKLVYCLPSMIYSVGTMMLLTGNTDSKLFYIDYVTIPLMYLIMFADRDEITESGSTVA